jgi:hypothetical protein
MDGPTILQLNSHRISNFMLLLTNQNSLLLNFKMQMKFEACVEIIEGRAVTEYRATCVARPGSIAAAHSTMPSSIRGQIDESTNDKDEAATCAACRHSLADNTALLQRAE